MAAGKKSINQDISTYKTGGDFGRPTPNPNAQNMTFLVGIVMDDSDDQRMSRLWVYVPGHSAKRFGVHSTPDYLGTVPDRQTGRLEFDAELRSGWLQCYPLMAYAGTDFARVGASPTGRSGREGGHSNSYGMWYQPRIGDHVGILFDGADPSQGYWIGCVPRFYSNFSSPGVTGAEKKLIAREADRALYDETPDDALIPTLEKINEQGGEQRFTETFPATDFANNLLEAGLIADPLRGAGLSSARRESPSYVMGMKSPGWDFDSERNNVNAETGLKFDNTPVGDSPTTSATSEYKNISTVGHQFVMDDHPDHQGIRLRTSAGSQLYFNDASATNPFIYLSTPRGKVWIELRDDGKADFFLDSDLSMHAGGDMNFVADGNMNFEAGGNMRTLVKGNQEMKIRGTSSWEMDSRFSIKASQGIDIDVIGSFLQNSSEETSFGAAGGTFYVANDGTMNFDTTGSINMTAAQSVGIGAAQVISLQSASSIALNGGGEVRAQAGAVWLNSGAGAPPIPATSGPSPSPIPQSDLESLPGAPTPTQIKQGGFPAPVETVASRLPQHQPWSGRSEATKGFGGQVDEGEDAPAQQGAARNDATAPLNFIGFKDGSSDGKAYRGLPYSTTSSAESPEYEEVRDPLEGELNDAETYSGSTRLQNFIKTKEGLWLRDAYLDAGVAWAIGYGHNIKIGDVINGTLSQGDKITEGEFRVDSDFIAVMNRTQGKALVISEAEANRIFLSDLDKFENAVRGSVTTPITQGQFDGLVTFSYNVGISALKNSTLLRRLNSNNFQDVPREWRRWNRSAGSVNKGLDARRQEELEFFWAASDSQLAAVSVETTVA